MKDGPLLNGSGRDGIRGKLDADPAAPVQLVGSVHHYQLTRI